MKRAWAAIGGILATGLWGCPPATGRHRGDPGDGGGAGATCPYSAMYGGSCSSVGTECSIETYCYGSATYSTCQCTYYGWQCDTTAGCGPYDDDAYPPPYDDAYPGYDATPVTGSCPATGVVDGTPCPPELGGTICDGGTATDCDGGTRSLTCACITGTWTCNTPMCDGGG